MFKKCVCSKTRKVPPAEQDFIEDQRTLNLMCTGNVDKLALNKLTMKFSMEEKVWSRGVEISIENVMSTPTVGDISSGPTVESEEDDNYLN